MNESKELLEQFLKTSLSKDVDQLVQRLDRRMSFHFESRKQHAQKPRRLARLRPALTFAMMVVALGTGFYLGNLKAPTLGPQALRGEPLSMALQSEKPAAIALYELSKAFDVGGFDSFSAPAKLVQQTIVAKEDVVSASSGETFALAPQAAEPVKAVMDQDISSQKKHMAETTASIGFMGKEVIVPTGDQIIYWKSNGERVPVGSALRSPIGVSIDVFGRIFVTEHHPNGALIALSLRGEKTTIREGLNYPAGIAFAKDHSLYLAEQGRGRVLRFFPLDNQITPESKVEVFATGFSGLLETGALDYPLPQGGPFALTITPNNELLVSDLVAGKTVIYRFILNAKENWWDWLLGNP